MNNTSAKTQHTDTAPITDRTTLDGPHVPHETTLKAIIQSAQAHQAVAAADSAPAAEVEDPSVVAEAAVPAKLKEEAITLLLFLWPQFQKSGRVLLFFELRGASCVAPLDQCRRGQS